MHKTAAIISFRVEEKQQNLSLEIDKLIPAQLIGDDQRISQVITNLLGNAVKFTPEKGSINLVTRFIGIDNGLCTIQVSVSDTGIGISEEHLAGLFMSFQQAEASTVRKFGGTGLGLAISKKIVELMGGKIWVESEFGKGSTFAFTFQAMRGVGKALNSNGNDLGQNGKADAPPMTAVTFSGSRILLVEDVEINREIVLALFEQMDMEIDCAENGVEAVNMFSASPDRYNLILMDLQMPEMDGFEATRRIREIEAEFASQTPKSELPSGVPIIAMTANVFKEDIEKCLEAGMNDHIGKPLDMDTVMEKLRIYLASDDQVSEGNI